ncbi:putative glycosyl [Golovinomyces cichoracearum]|uniref:Putative glycosyl n=1 Tax=Golovinomyces cichoracearum TaxID=62708 RepID=A0A420I3I7_9PEZI|nr:putative glycosyl [Golovinomyces cichoracearum]
MSTRFGLANEALVYAFPTMLKNIALSFYFNRCRGKSLAKLCQDMKDNFEGPEYQIYNLQKWNDVTFQLIIDQNSTKGGMEHITILINKLDKMQKALSTEFRTEEALQNKIIIACKDVEACKITCYRPSPTVPGLIRDLRSGIEIFSKPLPTSDVLLQQNNNSILVMTEHISQIVDIITRRDPITTVLYVEMNRKVKSAGFAKFKGAAEGYISEFEGEHENIESDNDFDMQAICEELDKTTQDNYLDSDLVLSNAGNITTEVGKGILATLADNSMYHLINSCTEQQVDVESSTFLSRYSSEIFRGILIDSRAAAYLLE